MVKYIGSFFIILCYSISTSLSVAQEISISGDFTDLSFEEFIWEIKKQVPVRFVYLESWMQDVSISVQGDSLDLLEVLEDQFRGRDLFFQVDENNRIFITQGEQMVMDLPDYATVNEAVETSMGDVRTNGLTDTERLYIEGRKKGVIGTLVIGNVADSRNQNEVIIHGEVKDAETGEPLIGATIFIEELSRGYITDLYGIFTISIPRGKYSAQFNCLGMEKLHYYLDVLSGGKLTIEMGKKLYPIDEITVRSDGYDHVRGIEMGFSQISVKSIKEIPAVMGEMDVLKVIQLLPGVQNTGEGSSGMNVRGSAADQNMYLIDKIPVYNTSHLFGFFSAFNPDIIRGFNFYKGNLPAGFGGRLDEFMFN